MSSLAIVFALNLSIWLTCVDSCSHWTAVYAWSTNAEHLWRPQDEQIWQPGANMQVCINIPHWIRPISSPLRTAVFLCNLYNSLLLDPAEVGSTWGGRPLRRAPASPPATAVDQDSSARRCRSPTPLSMKLDSTSAPTETSTSKMARLQQPLMCSSTVNLRITLSLFIVI